MTEEGVKAASRKVPWWMKTLRMGFFALGALPATFILLSLLAKVSFICEITSHFYPQYLCAIALSIGALLLLKQFRAVLLLLPFFLIAIAQIAPYYIKPSDSIPPNTPTISVLAYNVNLDNQLYNDVANNILSADADVVSIEEITPAMHDAIHQVLAKKYPYDLSRPEPTTFGIALYSKFPLTETRIESLTEFKPLHTAIAQVTVAGKQITVLAAHPPPPFNDDFLDIRTRCMAAYNNLIRADGGHTDRFIVVGDFNCSPWSPYFNDFLAPLQLHDSARGFGIQPTWPAQVPLIRTPIDHILCSGAFQTLERKTLPAFGSDHFAIYAKLAILR